MGKRKEEPQLLVSIHLLSHSLKGSNRMPSKKLLLVLFLIPSSLTFLKLFTITINTTAIAPLFSNFYTTSRAPAAPSACSYPPSAAPLHAISHDAADTVTPKEQNLLSNLIKERTPCNLLFFGLKPQLLSLASLNAGGTTVFLEDDREKLHTPRPRSESLRVYQVEYHTAASEAYNMLRCARADPACSPHEPTSLQNSSCQLMLKNLPVEVYERKWDVIVVDGPGGDRPEAPGRMVAIYSASMMARSAGNLTDVLVHDVDKIIERWYSWEFLCEQYLFSSKGKLWHFRIQGNLNSSEFCPESKIQIL